jgi:hypothetical protein
MAHPEALNDTPGTARTRSTSGPKPHHPRGLTPAGLHLLLTILTCGLWLPVWIVIEIVQASSKK